MSEILTIQNMELLFLRTFVLVGSFFGVIIIIAGIVTVSVKVITTLVGWMES